MHGLDRVNVNCGKAYLNMGEAGVAVHDQNSRIAKTDGSSCVGVVIGEKTSNEIYFPSVQSTKLLHSFIAWKIKFKLGSGESLRQSVMKFIIQFW